MATSATAAYATYPEHAPLNKVLQTLRRAGIEKESVCLLLSPTHPIAATVRESSSRPFEREANTVTAGAMSWLCELGAVLIPTFGFFVRSRKFLRALVTNRDSGSGCGHRANLVSLGFSPTEAKRFADNAINVGVLLYVACSEVDQTDFALQLLQETGAEESGVVGNEPAVEMALAATNP
jgi:hypothetical protein